jgi:hypothetical protein
MYITRLLAALSANHMMSIRSWPGGKASWGKTLLHDESAEMFWVGDHDRPSNFLMYSSKCWFSSCQTTTAPPSFWTVILALRELPGALLRLVSLQLPPSRLAW